MPGEMDSARNVPVKASSLVENIWSDANFPHSSLADALPTSHQVMVEFDNPEARAMLPSSHRGMLEFNNPEPHALPPPSSVLDRTAVVHEMNPFAMQFGCLPPSGSPVSHSSAMHVKMHVPSSYSLSTMECSLLSGNAAAHALCWSYSDRSFSSGNDAANATWPPNSSPLRLEFMQSFVNTLLPELKRIHSQSPPISLKEKLSAVRLAADMSLAISAGGNNTWSQALLQELASSSGSKVGVRRKNNVRKSNILRGRIYASILRRSSLRGSSHALRLQSRSHASRPKGPNSFACVRISTDCSLGLSAHTGSDISASLSGGSSHALRCKTSSCIRRRMRRVRFKRHSGLFSYVKILRNSRPTKSVKSPAAQRDEASKACAPSISKEHIASLGRVVPGGRNMDVPLLFQEAADYILSLQMQVEALQSLSHFVSL